MQSDTQQIELSPVQRLEAARRSLRRRTLVAACLQTLGVAAAGILLLDGINRFLPIRENAALAGLVIVLALAGLVFLLSCLRVLLRFPDVRELALRVEARNPELMDSLICAVEVEQLPPEQRGVLARALLEKTTAETGDRDFRSQVIPPGLNLGRFLFLAVVFSLLAALALRSELFSKAVGNYRDRRSGQTGIQVKPGNAEIPVNTDLTVTARVLRWQQAARIQVRSAKESRSYDMTRDREGRFEFTFFSVQEELRYRIVTPSLASAWYRITPFVPPVLEKYRLRVLPPAYTGQAPAEYGQPQDIKVLGGSLAEFEIQVAAAVTAELVVNRVPRRFAATSKTVRRLELTVQETLEGLIRLRTAAGRTAETPPFKIECIPDLPPVVAVLAPIQDIQVPPGEVVNTAVRATDDFGVTRIALCYAVSGGPRQIVPLFTAPPPATPVAGEVKPPVPVKEQQASANLHLKDLNVQDGSVLSVFFTATDNRQPQPQEVRSSVFFIMVRTEKKSAEAKGGEGEKKEMDLSGVIAELKRLIRLSWDVLAEPASAQVAGRAELLSGLRDLRLEVQKKINEIAEFTGAEPGSEPITAALQEAVQELETADKLTTRELVEDAIPPQERALAKIVAAETALMKNAAAAGKGGKPKDKPAKGDQEKSENQESGKGGSPGGANMVNELKEFLDRARQLSRQQEELNQQLERLPAENPPKTALHEAGAKESELEKTARELAVAMDRNPVCQKPSRELRGAASAMDGGTRGLEKENLREGQRQGTRAGSLLQAAVQSLEALHRKAAGAEIQRLAQETRQLAANEKKEAEATGGLGAQKTPVPDAEASQRKEAQTGLQEAAGKLQKETQAAAEALGEVYLDAARKLGEALAQAKDQNLDGAFTRSANALLYKRFDKASHFQNTAAGILDQVADKLKEAAKELPALSREELEQALGQIKQGQEAVRQLKQDPSAEAKAKLDELRQQFTSGLDRLAEGLQDQSLRQLAESMSKPLDGNAESAGNGMLEQLTSAGRILEQYLMNFDVNKRPALKRKAAAVPEAYRRLIEQYFKNLSESEERK